MPRELDPVGYLADLLDEHLAEPWPSSVEKGFTYGRVESVMIDAGIYGWALGVASGSRLELDSRARLEQARSDLALSLADIPDDGRVYYARLIRIADAALLGCDERPPTSLASLPLEMRGVARFDRNGEVSWHRAQAAEAIRALGAAGYVVLGLDLRRYTADGGILEVPWSTFEPTGHTEFDLAASQDHALGALDRADQVDVADLDWVVTTFRASDDGSEPTLDPVAR